MRTAPRVVLVGEPELLGESCRAVDAIGGRVLARIDWPGLVAGHAPAESDLVLACEALGLQDDMLEMALGAIDAAITTQGASVVVSVDVPALDLAAAALLDRPVQLLCDPTLAERVLALGLAAQGGGDAAIHDSDVYEGEAERLKRLNDEVARIADVLARLTRREAAEPRRPMDAPDRDRSFAEPLPDVAIDPAEIRRAIRGRRMRDTFFGAGLFEEPGWDMMLDLFAAELEETRVSVSSLCIAAAVAPTTALRWISKLTEVGLFERQPDPFDRRRAFMELSERASRAMRDYVAALRRAGLSLA